MPYYDSPYLPSCLRCDDSGCFECCPPEEIALFDLDNIDWEIFLFEQETSYGYEPQRATTITRT